MKLNMDSPLMRLMTKLADLMILNLTFIAACLPVFTIGAAWTALYYVALKMVRDRQSLIIRSFFASFRQNFRQATLLWLGVLALGGVLLLDLRAIAAMPPSTISTVFRVTTGVVMALTLMLLQYLFPCLARFEGTLRGTVKNACLMAVANLPKTLLMCAFMVLPVWLTLLNDYTMLSGFFVWLMFAFALIAVANSCLLVKIFERYSPASGAESDNADEIQ